MDSDLSSCRNIPRIVPTRVHLDALLGSWEMDGEMIRLSVEPGTGVLVAVTTGGSRVNPIRVISRGSRMEGSLLH